MSQPESSPQESSPPPPSVVAVEAAPDSLLLGWDEVSEAVAYELQIGCVRVGLGGHGVIEWIDRISCWIHCWLDRLLEGAGSSDGGSHSPTTGRRRPRARRTGPGTWSGPACPVHVRGFFDLRDQSMSLAGALPTYLHPNLHITVKSNMVRKKNLAPGMAYRFRVRARDRIDWNPFSAPAVVKVRLRCRCNTMRSLVAQRLRIRSIGCMLID